MPPEYRDPSISLQMIDLLQSLVSSEEYSEQSSNYFEKADLESRSYISLEIEEQLDSQLTEEQNNLGKALPVTEINEELFDRLENEEKISISRFENDGLNEEDTIKNELYCGCAEDSSQATEETIPFM